MRVLEFSVMGQQIEKRGDFSGLVAGSEQYMTAKFYFNREWAGKVKVAEFRRIDSKIAECFSEKNRWKLLHRENRGAARKEMVRERSRTGKRRNETVNKQGRSETGGMT